MKISTLLLSTLLYLFSSLAIAADTEIYYWVDETGKMHFSDTAVPGTEVVDVKDSNLLSLKSENSEKSERDDTQQEEQQYQQQEEPVTYQATIISPEDDMPLRSNEGTINIHVVTAPEKENTHKLQLYLDGKKLGSPQISQTIRALNIDRGTHQVQVELLDEDGSTLAKTQVVTVHLQRVSK